MRDAEGVVGHVFVEEIIGLGEWVSTRRAFGGARSPDAVAWRYQADEATGMFLAVPMCAE
jgi:hypothetical protein